MQPTVEVHNRLNFRNYVNHALVRVIFGVHYFTTQSQFNLMFGVYYDFLFNSTVILVKVSLSLVNGAFGAIGANEWPCSLSPNCEWRQWRSQLTLLPLYLTSYSVISIIAPRPIPVFQLFCHINHSS